MAPTIARLLPTPRARTWARRAGGVLAVVVVAAIAGAVWPSSGAVPPAEAGDRPAPEVEIEVDPPDPTGWRAEARAGRWLDAVVALDAAGLDTVADRADDLILAADALRLGGRPRDALPLLHRVVDAHADDPRAPAAAFTLGRALLAQGAAAAAARTFAAARALAPDGPLAEDALAREIEAWSAAGEVERARLRAGRYVELYPDGARAATIARFIAAR